MTINIDSVNLGTDPVAACLLPGWKQQGQLTEMSRSGSMMSETRTDYYGYNDRNELVSGTKDTAATNLTEYAYQYDDIGNRIISLDLGTNRTYTANALNQYTSISNSALSATLGTRFARLGRYPMGRDHPQGADIREIFTPTFDLDMRPRQRRRVARRSEATEPRSGRKRPRNQTLVQTATGDWQVTYNGENRPVSWTCGTTNIVMKFDRMGRRVEYIETVNFVTNAHHRFVYEITAAQAGRAQRALQAERTERSDEVPREPRYLCIQRLNALANNAAEISFVWDPTETVATRPLVFQRQGGWSFFYTHDMRPRRRRRVARRSIATEPRSGRKRPRNKNVSEVVSFQQARGVPAHYEYAPFGAVTAMTKATTITAFDVRTLNPFRFSSEYADDTLGLVYYNYRHYDPVTGRWLSRDKIEERGGFNLYRFCLNNANQYSDKHGESVAAAAIGAGAVAALIGAVGAIAALLLALSRKGLAVKPQLPALKAPTSLAAVRIKAVERKAEPKRLTLDLCGTGANNVARIAAIQLAGQRGHSEALPIVRETLSALRRDAVLDIVCLGTLGLVGNSVKS